ncbi:hypothetical protein ACXWQV_09855, partial [Streptococcus pyogenes]
KALDKQLDMFEKMHKKTKRIITPTSLPKNVETWFIQLTGCFRAEDIPREERYYQICGNMPAEIINAVPDIMECPETEKDSYNWFIEK